MNCLKSVNMICVHIIIIINYKHWLYDSTSPTWLFTSGLQHHREDCCFLVSVFWLSHHWEMWLGLITKVLDTRFDLVQLWQGWEFRRQNVTGTSSLDDMSHSKDIIAGPEYRRLQKIFVFSPPLQSLVCKFRIYKSRLNHIGSPKNRQKR